MTLKEYLNKIKFYRTLYLILRYLIGVTNLTVGCIMISSLLDEIIPVPIVVFYIYWFIIISIVIIFFFHLIYRLIEIQKNTCKYVQQELNKLDIFVHKDEFINAYQLEQKIVSQNINFSEQLAKEFIETIKTKISKFSPQKVVNFDKIWRVIPLNISLITMVFILYALPPHILKEDIYKIFSPRRSDILGIFIFPKNIKIPWGEKCEIKAIVEKSYVIYQPKLYIKIGDETKWFKTQFTVSEDFPQGKRYKYTIDSVKDRIFYKINFRGISTKKYVIEPIIYPKITNLQIIVEPPKYTGIDSIKIRSFNETKYLPGSRISFIGKVNKEIKSAKIVFSDKETIKLPLEDKNTFRGSFIAKKTTNLWFEILDVEDLSNIDIIKYEINVEPDKIPEIEVISPVEDLIVSPNSKINIVYSAKDDISVSQVKLNYNIENKNVVRNITIKSYKNIPETIDEYTFDLSTLNLNYGDVITYYLTIYDNDTVSGPKYSFSEKKKVEIFSFERQHELIQKEINQLDKKILEYLSKEIELKEHIEKLTTGHFSITELDRIIGIKNLMSRNYENLLQDVSTILSKLLNDPYTSVDTYIEFQGLQNTLQQIANRLNPSVVRDLQNNNFSSATLNQEQIVDSLERLSSITENLVKKQNMTNIVETSNRTYTTAKELLNELSSITGKLTPEQKTKLENLLKEIDEKLNQLTAMLEKQKQNLPEEFINRRDVKNVDIISPQNVLNQLYNAISRGDITSALKLAEQLLKQLESLTETFNKASSEISSSDFFELQKEFNELTNKLDTLIDEEEKIYHQTKQFDDYRIEQIVKQQLSILQEITKKVELALIKIRHIKTLPEIKTMQNRNLYLTNISIIEKNLENIKTELSQERLIQTSKWVQEAKVYSEENYNLLKHLSPKEYSQVITLTTEIKDIIYEIEQLLSQEHKVTFPEKIKKENQKTVIKQNNIKLETEEFVKKLKLFGKKSFLILPTDIVNANKAVYEMSLSAKNLYEENFPSAMQNQTTAINLLKEIREGFNRTKSQMDQMTQGLGQPIGSRVQYKTQPGGIFGVLEGKVVLPSAKEYSPPKELREDIIKSLSERYPEEFNKIIQKYYQELLR